MTKRTVGAVLDNVPFFSELSGTDT